MKKLMNEMDKLIFTVLVLSGILPGVLKVAAESNNQKTTVINVIAESKELVYRPNYDTAEPVEIDCDLHINSIDSVTEVNMEFTVEAILHLTWMDERLGKKFRNYDEVDVVEMVYQKMTNFWVPDIFFPNEKKAAFHNIMSRNTMLHLHKNHTVIYITRLSLTLSCPMNLRNYPFDQQRCSIKMESFGLTNSQLKLRWSNSPKPLLIKEGMELQQFKLHGDKYSQTDRYSRMRGNYSSLRADFFMVRNINYYVIQMYIPSLLIVMFSWVSFWLNVGSVPGRVNLGVLSVLTISTQSSSVNRSLPRVSYTKAIDIWMATCLVFVVAALIEFAIANVVSRRGSGKGMLFIKKITKLARNKSSDVLNTNSKGCNQLEGSKESLRFRDNAEKSTTVSMDGSVEITPNCQHLTIEDDDIVKKKTMKNGIVYAFYLDVASRVLFPLAFGVFNMVYWIYYLNVMTDIDL